VTVTAPPRPAHPSDPVTHGEFDALVEALIEEARQRGQRRRRRNAAVVTLVTLVGVAVFALLGRSAQSQTASPALSARSSLIAGTANSKIAFTSELEGGQASGGLYVVNADGSGKRTLAPTASQTPAWSPDGRRIAFVESYPDYEMYVINSDGSEEQELSRGETPVWSPDGRKIAFVVGVAFDSSEIYVMNADGSEQRRLTRNAASDFAPAWSPDGRRIAFRSRRDGNWEIYVMNANGNAQRRLTRNLTYDGDPAWSPDGRRIAFVSNWQIFVMNADGSGKRRLTRSAGHDASPGWSPEGQTITFERRLGRRSTGPCSRCASASIFEVYVMNANGSGQLRLSHEQTKRSPGPGSHGVEPLWSPDGRKIAFRSARDGNWEIYIMNPDGSGQRNLTRNPAEDDCCFAWSPAQ
jgi:Tol biopolymer transport system component